LQEFIILLIAGVFLVTHIA